MVVVYKLLLNKMGTKDATLARDTIAPVLKQYSQSQAISTKASSLNAIFLQESALQLLLFEFGDSHDIPVF